MLSRRWFLVLVSTILAGCAEGKGAAKAGTVHLAGAPAHAPKAPPKAWADETECLSKKAMTYPQDSPVLVGLDVEKLTSHVNSHVLTLAARPCQLTVINVRLEEGEALTGLLEGGKYQDEPYEIHVMVKANGAGGRDTVREHRVLVKVAIKDEDECSSGKGYGKCGKGLVCTNTNGSYACQCQEEGYAISKTFDQTKDALTAWESPQRAQSNLEKAALRCTRIDYCAKPELNGCDTSSTTCVNSEPDLEHGVFRAPGYTCKCKDPDMEHVVGDATRCVITEADLKMLMKCCEAHGPHLSGKACPAMKHGAGCENKLDCPAIDIATRSDPQKIKDLLFGADGPLPGGNVRLWNAAPDSICFHRYTCEPGFAYKELGSVGGDAALVVESSGVSVESGGAGVAAFGDGVSVSGGGCVDIDECARACSSIFDEGAGESAKAWSEKDLDGWKADHNQQYGGPSWTLSGKRCHDCDHNAACSNTIGGFECKCGWARDAKTGLIEQKDKDFKSNKTNAKGQVDGWTLATKPPPNFDWAGHTVHGCKDDTLPKVVPMCCTDPAGPPAPAGALGGARLCATPKVECITLTTDADNRHCCGADSPSGEDCAKFQMVLDRANMIPNDIRGKPLPEGCTIKVPQYQEIKDLSFKVVDKNADRKGMGRDDVKTWAESQYFKEVDTTMESYRRKPAFGLSLPVTHDCADPDNRESKCDLPFTMDYAVNGDSRLAARVVYEIVNVNECDGTWVKPGTNSTVPAPYFSGQGTPHFSSDWFKGSWGQKACADSAHCVDIDNSKDQKAPFECVCQVGWTGNGSYPYRYLANDVSEKWGQHGYSNLRPLGYDALLAKAGPGCVDSHPPEVTCSQGAALKETLKVGCDCDNDKLGSDKSWMPALSAHVTTLDLSKLCRVWDYDRTGKKVQLLGLPMAAEGDVRITPGCDAREKVCEAFIMVGAKDGAGNPATPTKLIFMFSARDSMQEMEERLLTEMRKLARKQGIKTKEVKDAVRDTTDKIEGLTECTSDMCKAMQLLKFSRLCWLALLVLLINGVHTQAVRALFIAAHCGNIYYPNEQQKFESGAGLYLMVTRLGFMDAHERRIKAQAWWTEMGENKED